MTQAVDFFFSTYPTAQERRLRAALEDGLAHGSRIEPHDPLPNVPVSLLFSTNIRMSIGHVAIYYTTDGSEPQGEWGSATNGTVVEATPGETIFDSQNNLSIQQWRAILPAQPDSTLVRYRADGWTAHEPSRHYYADNVDPVGVPPLNGRLFAYHVDSWSTPAWWHDAIIYQIVIDRFSAGADEPRLYRHDEQKITDFFGGTLNGIREKLTYLQSLGVNCLWLSPVFESPTPHGYNPSDYHTVARRYGTNEALRQLIKEAHQRGMHVLLDFVANHTSDEHPAFLAAQNNPQSATALWYAFDPKTHTYRSYAGVSDMPELKTENTDVQKYLIEAALHWLNDFGADGLRLDYVPGPTHAFWTRFQQAIKQQHPQALTLGEITSPLAEIANYAGRMDGFMDFPLSRLLRSTFAQHTTTLMELLTFLDARLPSLPPTMSRATLLDNHDTHRFLWLADGHIERLKLASVCHMTLDGTPIIYYGTEVGLSQYQDAHKENAYARAPMLWDKEQNLAILEHYRRLITLRHSYPALRTGARASVTLNITDGSPEEREQVGAYLRYQDGQYLLIVLNNNESPVKVRIHLLDALNLAGIDQKLDMPLHNLLDAAGTEVFLEKDGTIECSLAPLDASIYAQ